MPSIPIADKPTLDQVLAYVDTLESLIGTANPASPGDLTTLFKGLRLLANYVDELETRLTAARAGKLDNLDALISSRAAAADWTAARAGKLDLIGSTGDGSGVASLFGKLAAVLADTALIKGYTDQVEGFVDALESNLGTTGDAANAAGTVLARLAELLTNRLTTTRAGYLDGARYYRGSYLTSSSAWVNVLSVYGRGELNHLMMNMGGAAGSYQVSVDGTVIMSGSLVANNWHLPTIQGGLLQMNAVSGNIVLPPLNIRFKTSLLIEVYPAGASLNTVFGYNLI
jgi:hypothetical protein